MTTYFLLFVIGLFISLTVLSVLIAAPYDKDDNDDQIM